MPSIPLYPPRAAASTLSNPLPKLLQTPSGLAILEIQGTIHTPPGSSEDSADAKPSHTSVGTLVFPDYSPSDPPDDTKWMKRVYLYVGRHQRMTGEVRKLARPVGVVRRRGLGADGEEGDRDGEDKGKGNGKEEELEIVEVVRHKVVFSSRPEPVGGE
ncbi:hypothetical protein W97_07020 [Coniosporium apollinis CBS 100218]|uniref:Chromosome transmission fidelity protein 8 n=1 Tax=Coniosporium apollinis (strain CBS 100218) TaxID=1168221 RepID=R7Z1H7_CONA1|nr:uncharacterized protein W97_07020 [Coniosporium apollinis CBS 100218]EON67766.1 hypothetical protein W97_07020 [Coniosporium apollinis CBS 100218]